MIIFSEFFIFMFFCYPDQYLALIFPHQEPKNQICGEKGEQVNLFMLDFIVEEKL